MATLSKMCPVCGQQRMFRTGRPVNHWLHLAMTLLTGIWIIVWITLVVSGARSAGWNPDPEP